MHLKKENKMKERDESRYGDVMNSFAMYILTNDGFERHAKFSKEH